MTRISKVCKRWNYPLYDRGKNEVFPLM